MNEVNETLRSIRNEIEFHKMKKNTLKEANEIIDNSKLDDESKQVILDSIRFKWDFHNHKITRLVVARDELMKKYHIPEND